MKELRNEMQQMTMLTILMRTWRACLRVRHQVRGKEVVMMEMMKTVMKK